MITTANPARVREVEIQPQFIPAALADVTARDLHMTEVVLTNVTGAL